MPITNCFDRDITLTFLQKKDFFPLCIMDVRLSAGGFDSVGVTLSCRQKCTSRVERMGSCGLYCNLGDIFGIHQGAYNSNGCHFFVFWIWDLLITTIYYGLFQKYVEGGGVFLPPPPPPTTHIYNFIYNHHPLLYFVSTTHHP